MMQRCSTSMSPVSSPDKCREYLPLGIIYLKYLWAGGNATCTVSIGREGGTQENDCLWIV
jgi:hypothetical protein